MLLRLGETRREVGFLRVVGFGLKTRRGEAASCCSGERKEEEEERKEFEFSVLDLNLALIS